MIGGVLIEGGPMPKGGRPAGDKRKDPKWIANQVRKAMERHHSDQMRITDVAYLRELTETLMLLGCRIEYHDEMQSIRAIKGAEHVWLRRRFPDRETYVISEAGAEELIARWA